MDSLVTLKFFRVSLANPHNIPFERALKEALNLGPSPSLRELDINAGIGEKLIVRLERMTETDDVLFGEIIRKQISNIPPEAHDSGLSPIRLSNNGGIGLSAVFRYHKPTKTLVLQSNIHAMTQSRLNYYLKSVNVNAEYVFDPIPTVSAWERFNSGVPRRVKMRIASPEKFAHLAGSGQAIAKGVADIGEALHAPYITIEVSMGRKRGGLFGDATRKFIESVLAIRESSPSTIEMLSASVAEDGSGADMINFLDEHLVVRDRLDLNDLDPDRNYEVRRDFAKAKFDDHYPYIHQTFHEE